MPHYRGYLQLWNATEANEPASCQRSTTLRYLSKAPIDRDLRAGGRGITETENSLIAIVDDDRLIRRSLERLLKSAGLRAKSFHSGENYLDEGDHDDICCIIVDIGLPGMSGFELDRRLAAEPSRLPVVFISACDESELERKATQTGAIAFLRKPFKDDAILNAVQTGMELLKNRRQ